jgi:phage shock protein A
VFGSESDDHSKVGGSVISSVEALRTRISEFEAAMKSVRSIVMGETDDASGELTGLVDAVSTTVEALRTRLGALEKAHDQANARISELDCELKFVFLHAVSEEIRC